MRTFTTIILYFIASLLPLLAKAQMEFVENKGQWHPNVKFKGDFSTGAFFLEDKGFSVMLHNAEDIRRVSEIVHGHGQTLTGKRPSPAPDEKLVVNSFGYKVRFLGASVAKQLPEKPLPGLANYFIGSDAGKWGSNCKIYEAISYQEIYPNIDVRYYSSEGKLKYDFIVRPGGNPDYIAMEYLGPQSISLKEKELVISTTVGDVRELYPYSYQSATGKNQEVECKYVLKGNVVSFKVGKYDPAATLIIDPSIIFSSFTGSTSDNWGFTATPGPDGSLFAGGISFGTGYPVSAGAVQNGYGGGATEGGFPGHDIAIFKFSANGSNRIYATYYGGSRNEQPHSLIADQQGNLVIAGRSSSGDFPGVPATSKTDYDIVLVKLNATGSAIIGAAKIGGSGDDGVNIRPKYPPSSPSAISIRRNYGDDARSEVILDAANNIYLASCTQSTSGFPVVNAVQSTFGGGLQDGVILKFNPNLSTLLFSTLFGGDGDDACFVASINPVTGDLFVAGGTTSNNLPGDKTGVLSPANNGGITDGFVTQLTNNGSSIVRTSFIGTGGIDLVYGLKFDRAGFPYIMGTTTGAWPVVNATFSNTGGKQFISKLNPDLSGYVYSTVFGTNSSVPNISPVAFLVDRCENVYVSGWGGGINVSQGYTTGTTAGLPEVNPLAGIPAADTRDFYFFVLEKNATSQLFGSHFGEVSVVGDHVDGGTSRFDDNGIIYQAICANCNRQGVFPTTAGVWSSSNKSTQCNQAVVKIEMNFAGVGAGVQASINSVKNDTLGCIPLYVKFSDTLRKGKKFYWNFGDGSPAIITTSADTAHTYTVVGTYLVQLIAEDSSTCNIRDTAYVTIVAGNNRANLDFNFAKLPPCQSLTMQYTNTSTATIGSFGPQAFVWDYGDGSPKDTAGLNPPRVHTYAAPGTYLVKLTVIDPAFCNTPETIEKEVRINPLVKAQFTTPALGCAPYTAEFTNTSLAGTDFIWDFGDGGTSTDVNPTHLYSNPGTYNVRLIAIDLSTCNLRDTSAFFTIRVEAKPTAFFTWSPNPPVENTPVQFTNSSTGANRYLWNFGDGESSTLTNPSHQYNATGTYPAELIAYTEAGCTDTFNLDVNVIIVPLLDVPNAFTPAQGGRNAVVRVEGFGIGKMQWRIYNRQGVMVFQTSTIKFGWDGTYKGKLQPMDVYTYTLDVEFTDGKKIRKTGDISLLR